MLGVLSAERTILFALKLLGSILLILDGIVVSLLALFTSQSDFDSVVSHTFRHLLYYLSAFIGANICLPVWGLRLPFSAKNARKKKPLVRQVIDTIPYLEQEVKHFFLYFQWFSAASGS